MISYVSWFAFFLGKVMPYCKLHVVGLYPNMPHDQGLIAMTKALDLQKDKRISTESLLELSESVLKNTISEQNSSFYKRLRGTAFSTKMVPSYGVIFYFVFLGGRRGGESVILRKDFLIIVIFRLQFDGGMKTTFSCFGNMVKKSQRNSQKN